MKTINKLDLFRCIVGFHDYRLEVKKNGFIDSRKRKCIICGKKQWKDWNGEWYNQEKGE